MKYFELHVHKAVQPLGAMGVLVKHIKGPTFPNSCASGNADTSELIRGWDGQRWACVFFCECTLSSLLNGMFCVNCYPIARCSVFLCAAHH